ncbi:MAG: heparinase II/III family protein [Pseudomonadota bacterium]
MSKADGPSAPSTFDRLRQRGRHFAFTNPLYERSLRGPVPESFVVIPPDPWPGRSDLGHSLLTGLFTIHGRAKALGDHPFHADQPWSPLGWWQGLHGFHWLRHLRAAGGDNVRRLAARYLVDWVDTYPQWHEQAWALSVTGARLSHWLSQYPFYGPSLDQDQQRLVLDSAARQARHLAKQLSGAHGLSGADHIAALKGWVLFALATDLAEFKPGAALNQLAQALDAQLAGDDGHLSRNPQAQLGVLRDLIDIRATLVATGGPVLPSLGDMITRLVPGLRLFRHGDGGLATMNGGLEGDPLVIDTALAQADARGRPAKSMPQTGYERIAIGRTVVLIDTGQGPAPPFDHDAHAGLFGFELSHGRERIIVSCGHDQTHGGLFDPLRATAASSTLVVADTNAAEVTPGGGLGRQPDRVISLRETGGYGTRVVMSHNGWDDRFGLTYDRSITVSDSGEAVFGEEKLTGTAGHRFTIRFHLAPDIQVSPVQGGALIKPLSGTGWRFQAQGAELGVEESIYTGSGTPRRCYQLVLTGETEDKSALALTGDRRMGSLIGWSLTRERKPNRPADTNQPLTLSAQSKR